MERARFQRVFAALPVAASLMAAFCVATATLAQPAPKGPGPVHPHRSGGQSPAVELTERARELIAEQEFEEAVEVLDRAIAADEHHGMAHYQRGRALAQLGRMEEAQQSLLRSTVLQPGFAHGHLLASLAAQQLGDYELAWDQAARAIIAGREPSEFGALHQASPAPPEVLALLEGWKVFVVGVDTRELIAGDQMPDNARGGTRDIRSTLGQVQDDLLQLQRLVANAISDTPGFGLVPNAEMAQYLLVITPESISADPRASMEGDFRLYAADGDRAVFTTPVSFRTLSAEAAVRVEVERFIGLLENWKAQR